MPAHHYSVDVTTDGGLTVERRFVFVTSVNPHKNVLQALTGALNAVRQDMQLPPVAASPRIETLADQAADHMASQQAMPDDGALEALRELVREAGRITPEPAAVTWDGVTSQVRALTDCCRTPVGTGHREDCEFRRGIWTGTMPGAPVCEHCGTAFTFTPAGQLRHPLPWCPARQDMGLPPVPVNGPSGATWDSVASQVQALTSAMRTLCTAGIVPPDGIVTALADLEEQAEDAYDLRRAARRNTNAGNSGYAPPSFPMTLRHRPC